MGAELLDSALVNKAWGRLDYALEEEQNHTGAAILSFERKSEDKGQYPEQLPQTTGTDQCLLTVKVWPRGCVGNWMR